MATAKRLGIELEKIPHHIAIIMDGNGRWATKRGLPRFQGHRQGARTVEKIVDYCVDVGIEALTLYSFSMQNWKRPKLEVTFLMQLYTRYLIGIRKTLKEHNVRLVHMGRTEKLPLKLVRELNKTVEISSEYTGMVLALALNYGSREEIIDGVKKICRKCVDGELDVEEIDENLISNSLYTASLPDPDLLIRTSDEKRISNFLLWQISYTEFYVTDTLWPDFAPADIDKAIIEYSKRARRLGDIKPSLV
ncbi:MAG: isoprenyl transferase [Planctomycetes bacterium]|nr:isoprenyl transferase [Planctomycetota bacterium]MBU1517582.1 isoprenyl transferase [Planctomycetota bacterium]MBU2457036.1 isoprenyl transferase [Planctomycetota bacterium]MBU2597103.1 isoprenyl transferase [Planctomycetota bacterium]